MCGISGAIALRHSSDLVDTIRAIVASQRTRGPDFERVEVARASAPSVVLGHNRLSILDIGERAHQPMWNAERTLCIVYNGEIYNFVELRDELRELGHRFGTTSDTEVILAAMAQWGDDAIARMNGMFAFALFDANTGTVRLVRDRFGVKPLYYAATPDAAYFASTTPALARALALEPDTDYLARGARTWIFERDDGASAYRGLRALPPGHMALVRREGTRIDIRETRYYDLEQGVARRRDELAELDERAIATRVLATFDDAVSIRLRSDVPLAVSLSGGLDSTSVAATVARRQSNVTGFTFGHPSALETEGPLVDAFAKSAAIRAEFVWPDAARIDSALWETLAAQDAPFGSASVVAQFLLFKRVRERGVKVLLGGQGGDEAFMGYRKFHVFRVQRLLRDRRWIDLVRALTSVARVSLVEARRAHDTWRAAMRYRSARDDRILAMPSAPDSAIGIEPNQPLWKRQLLDVTRFSLPTLLRYEDRNSMAHSVESRLPFVDYRVIELGIALPEALKLRAGRGKAILRDVMEGRVPDDIRLSRLKRGFDVDQAGWIAGGLGAAIRGRLHDQWSAVRSFVAAGHEVDTAFSDQRLAMNWTTFIEAMTLLWLAEQGPGVRRPATRLQAS
jgi:asparagine synthase (glutamine-hydrolysing)